jgi:hypothetical protein
MSINLTNNYLRPNLEYLIRQAEPYAGDIGWGMSSETYSGSISIEQGRQDYDLFTDLKDESGVALADYMPSGSKGRMRIVEVFHEAPVQYVFNSNLASNYMANGLPMESFVPDARFHILPVFEDVLRAGLMKDAQKIRRSNYKYKISGRMIRFYPVPSTVIGATNNKIWMRVIFPADPTNGIYNDSGSYSISGSSGLRPPAQDDTLYGVSNPANAPFGLISYDSINPWAKNWIFEYTFALCTELLGRVRSKFKTIPIPGAELTLNGDDLVAQGREDKDNLLYGENGLMAKLNSMTYDKLQEMEANKAEMSLKQLRMIPMPPTHNVGIF